MKNKKVINDQSCLTCIRFFFFGYIFQDHWAKRLIYYFFFCYPCVNIFFNFFFFGFLVFHNKKNICFRSSNSRITVNSKRNFFLNQVQGINLKKKLKYICFNGLFRFFLFFFIYFLLNFKSLFCIDVFPNYQHFEKDFLFSFSQFTSNFTSSLLKVIQPSVVVVVFLVILTSQILLILKNLFLFENNFFYFYFFINTHTHRFPTCNRIALCLSRSLPVCLRDRCRCRRLLHMAACQIDE